MISFEDIQAEFRAQADKLLAKPLCPTTLLLRDLIGQDGSPRALFEAGWRLLHAWDGGRVVGTWQDTIWFEKAFEEAGSVFVFQLGVSSVFIPVGPDSCASRKWIPSGEPLAQALRGERPAAVFARNLLVSRVVDGGIRMEPAEADVPEALVRRAREELVPCFPGPPSTFLDDLAFQTWKLTFPSGTPEPDAEFHDRLAAFAEIVGRQPERGATPATVRLLLPLAAAIRGEDGRDAAERLLVFSDTDLAIRLLGISAAATASRHPEIEEAIGAWLLIIAASLPETAFDTPLWETLAKFCLRRNLPLAAVLAADRAADLASPSSEAADRLARALLLYFRSVPLQPDDSPRNLSSVIEVLMRREDALKDVSEWPEGSYWSLLGLALKLNGSSQDLVESTLGRALPPSPPAGSGLRAGDCLAISAPLQWQSFACGLGAHPFWTIRQLRAFPRPILEVREDRFWQIPTRFAEGLPPSTLWGGLAPCLRTLREEIGRRSAREGTRWKLRSRVDPMAGAPDLWEPLLPQISDRVPEVAIRAFRWFEPGKELGFVSTWASIPSDPRAEPVLFGLFPIADHYHEANATVTTWEWFAYSGNDGGEARVRLVDGRPIRALVPLFVGDRQTVERGVPRTCWFSAISIDIAPIPNESPRDIPEAVARRRAARGAPVAARMVEPGDLDSGPICYLRGRVAAIRTVGLAGCPDVIRLDLEVGLPFVLPVYVRPRKQGEEPFAVGGTVGGLAIPLVDYFNPPDQLEAWFDEHPNGAGPEPRWSEPGRKKAVRSHPKHDLRDPDRALRPVDFRIDALAGIWLEDRHGAGNVERWEANPSGAGFAVRLSDGTVRRYCSRRCVGDEPPPDHLPDDCGCVVVRFRDAGDSWSIEYEDIPPRKTV